MHQKPLATCIGFSLLFPVQLLGGENVRLNDAVAVLLACALGADVFGSAKRIRSLHGAYAAIALLTIGWTGADLIYRVYMPENLPATMVLVRWIVALPSAYYLALLCEETTFRRYLFAGFILGCVGTSAIGVFDFVNFQVTGQPAFPQNSYATTSFVNGDYRASGFLAHANSQAIASLFIVPFAVGAVEEFGWHRGLLILAFLAALVVFTVTQTRGALVASMVVLLVWALVRRPALVFAGLGAVVAVIGLTYTWNPALFQPDNGGTDLLSLIVARFDDQSSIDANASDRIETTMTSLDLALQHPFGMGSTYETPLENITGFAATHNAWLQLALMGGFPLMGIIVAVIGRAALSLLWVPRLTHSWVALYLLIVSMFEAAFYLPFFPTIVTVGFRTGLDAKIVHHDPRDRPGHRDRDHTIGRNGILHAFGTMTIQQKRHPYSSLGLPTLWGEKTGFRNNGVIKLQSQNAQHAQAVSRFPAPAAAFDLPVGSANTRSR